MPPKRSAAQYLWVALIARIYEVFPLLCPMCGGQMRIVAFITHSAYIRQMLDHIGEQAEPPNIAPARGPPLWEDCDAPVGEGVESEPDWDMGAVQAMLPRIRQHVSIPVGVGFGIRYAATAKAVGKVADAVVIGSKIIRLIEHAPRDKVAGVARDFLAEIRVALDI